MNFVNFATFQRRPTPEWINNFCFFWMKKKSEKRARFVHCDYEYALERKSTTNGDVRRLNIWKISDQWSRTAYTHWAHTQAFYSSWEINRVNYPRIISNCLSFSRRSTMCTLCINIETGWLCYLETSTWNGNKETTITAFNLIAKEADAIPMHFAHC